MNTFPVILLALGVLAIGYLYYSKFIAMTVLGVDETRTTPAHTQYDGQNYYPMSKWVLFGHHFAGIAGSGPLIGPTLSFFSSRRRHTRYIGDWSSDVCSSD